ncbi:PilZ domain-containing protein [Candidatus Omnitrophota bacterium]
MEQRKDIRFNKEFVVTYKIQKESGDVEVSCHVKNFSTGGMQILTAQWLPPQGTFDFTISTPLSKKQINLLGKVLECIRDKEKLLYESRISFILSDDQTKEILEKALEEIRWHQKGVF